jgi:DNA-binding CsgD family transcriptional regulator
MIYADRIKAAVDDVVAAALLGEGWEESLARLARAAEARHAVLMRNAPHRVVAVVSDDGAAEAIADYMAGRAPPNSRYRRVDTGRADGFRVDHDDYSDDLLARDPYYQEFLRPKGIFWHANATLVPGRDEYVELSLKRSIRLGPYQRDDAAILNSALADLQAAARIARNTLDAEARGMSWALGRRGELVVEIDSSGRVLSHQSASEAGPTHPFQIRNDRLAAVDPLAQAVLDRAVAKAVARPGRMGVAPLAGPDGRRYLLQVHPVPGPARDVFLSAQAIAVLIERDRQPSAVAVEPSAIRDAFGLTDREAEVAGLLAEGLDVAAIAVRLRIRPDTVRTYLKDVLEKTGTHRQAELVALLARLGQ